jgi:hypothetical protein
MALLAGAVMLGGQNLKAAEDKPLGPGWLSLDNSVGKLDGAIANGKGGLENALGIGISGFIDMGYTWSSNHPGNGANISGRYFNKDNNQFNVNNFHLALEKPEKDWGVGFRVSGDFGRYGELLHEATQWNKTGARLCCAPSAELREAYLRSRRRVSRLCADQARTICQPFPSQHPGRSRRSRSFMCRDPAKLL